MILIYYNKPIKLGGKMNSLGLVFGQKNHILPLLSEEFLQLDLQFFIENQMEDLKIIIDKIIQCPKIIIDTKIDYSEFMAVILNKFNQPDIIFLRYSPDIHWFNLKTLEKTSIKKQYTCENHSNDKNNLSNNKDAKVTKKISMTINDMSNKQLLWEIYLKSSWGLESREEQSYIEQLLMIAANRGSNILKMAKKNKNLGINVYHLIHELKKRYRQYGETQKFYEWFDALVADSVSQHPWVVKSLQLSLEKEKNYQKNKKNKNINTTCEVIPPHIDETRPHPNSLRHLSPHSSWNVFIDETGSNFSDVENLKTTDQTIGRFVALIVPKDIVKLPKLKEKFHACDESNKLLDHIVNTILCHPVGVIGLSSQDILSHKKPDWFSSLNKFIQLIIRLLPLKEINEVNPINSISIYIEQRSNYTSNINMYAVSQLILSELYSLNSKKYNHLNLNIQFVEKDSCKELAYVDALAHTWGGSSAQNRLKQAQFMGHCFLRPSDELVERIYAVLDDRKPLNATDWYKAVIFLEKEASHSLLSDALHLLGEKCIANIKLWNIYLQEVKEHLLNKKYTSKELYSLIDWLKKYQPENSKIPKVLQLYWLNTQLAINNHMGKYDLELIQQGLDLCQSLQDEEAIEVCLAYLRMSVSAINAFEFMSAQQLMDIALKQPIAAVGKLNYGKILSTMGQIYAFKHQYKLSIQYFDQALEVFLSLTNAEIGNREYKQTNTYKLIQIIDNDDKTYNIEALLQKHFKNQSLEKIYHKYAQKDDDKFQHHLLIHALIFCSDFSVYIPLYLEHYTSWKMQNEHPWQLINMWRAFLLHFNQKENLAQKYFSLALQRQDNYEETNITLIWIECVISIVACKLGYHIHKDIEETIKLLKLNLPFAPYNDLEKLMNCNHSREDILKYIALCLPFNFK